MKTPPRTQPARRTLHVLHAANFLVLTATGLLIQFPDWRAALLGDYGMLMSSVHHWCGVVFGVLPVLLILLVGPWLWRDSWKRASRRNGRAIRRGNLIAALAGVVGFVLTGAILWWDPPTAARPVRRLAPHPSRPHLRGARDPRRAPDLDTAASLGQDAVRAVLAARRAAPRGGTGRDAGHDRRR
jgi:hypothetical protein